MKRKHIVGIFAATVFSAPFISPLDASAQSERMRELEQQQQELDDQSQNLDTQIQQSENQMQSLEEERSQLEEEVTVLQANIDELVENIQTQQEEVERIEVEIVRLQSDIQQLEEQIEQRTVQLKTQARSVQTKSSPADLVDIILSAENLSDLIGRIGVVSQLVSANRGIMQDQVDDQLALEETEAQVLIEQEEVEQVKNELEISRNNLVTQRVELDDKIIQVAESHNMTEEERDSFVNEQQIVAQRTSTLSAEMQQEQERIIEEERLRQEEERRLAEEEQRRQEEEQARAEAQAARDAQAEREAQAARDAQAERETQAAREAQASRETQAATSSSRSESPTESEPANDSDNDNSGNGGGEQTSSGWTRPASGRISSPFGYRTHPIFGERRMHTGIDIAGSGPIVAARAGTVVVASFNSSLGYYVEIDHGDGYKSVYSHMQPNLRVAPGQQVSQGQQIGIMGTTGDSTGVHLDFKILRNDEYVNPVQYIGG